MSTRRSFMWLSGLVAPAATLTKWAPAAMAQESEQRGGITGSRPLPTSIAALPSMASQVQPITNSERLVRIEKAKKLMTESKIDAIVLAGGTSTLYFANARIGGSERLWAIVIPAKQTPFNDSKVTTVKPFAKYHIS